MRKACAAQTAFRAGLVAGKGQNKAAANRSGYRSIVYGAPGSKAQGFRLGKAHPNIFSAEGFPDGWGNLRVGGKSRLPAEGDQRDGSCGSHSGLTLKRSAF